MSSNARPLRLVNLPLLALAGRGPYANHAVTAEHGAGSATQRPGLARLLRDCLQPGGRQVWVSRDGLSLLGLTAVRPRSGDSAWEIDALMLGLRSEAFVLDLLERCIATAGAHGAHRLFLRLPAGSPLLPAARRQGFASVCEETLLSAPASTVERTTSTNAWRRKGRGDDHDLFRLFSACTPQEVRWQTALSPREWRAAQDRLGRRSQEWLLPDEAGRARAFVRLRRDDSCLRATLLAADRPEVGRAIVDLLATQARAGGRARRTEVLIPGHLPVLASVLREHGFQDEAQFDLSARPIAQRTQRLQLAERSVEGTVRPVIQ